MGAGSWGTTFAQVLCDAGTPAALYCRRPELAKAINATRQNPDYLPGIALTDAIRATAEPADALDGADLVILAVPAQTLRQNLADWVGLLSPGRAAGQPDEGHRAGHLHADERGDRRGGRTCRPSGSRWSPGPTWPSRSPSASTAPRWWPAPTHGAAGQLQKACHTGYFRPYTNPDVIGCELGGAVKNVIALAVGIAVGMGLGDNTRAMLITRGLAEITRLGAALGADQHTFAGLAGMGDLVATCSSPLSRNRTFGEKLGRGMPLAEVLAATTQTAEGVKSSESVLQLAGRTTWRCRSPRS